MPVSLTERAASKKEMEMIDTDAKKSNIANNSIPSDKPIFIDSAEEKEIDLGKMAVLLKVTNAFKEAGARIEERRTGTSLAREGTGMHDTLSRIRSIKGRRKHLKFVSAENSGVLERPENVRFLFSEDDMFKKVWTVLILFLVVFTSIVIPIQFGFPDGMADNPGLDYTIDVLFITDLFICFRTAYVNDAGDEVFDTKMIAQNYLKNWFAIDLIACFPGEVIILITQSKDSKSKILLRLLKMPRLLRIGRLFKYLNEFKYAAAWRVIKLVVMLMFVSHWIACLFIMTCRLEYESNQEVWTPFVEHLTSSFGDQYMFALLTAFSVLIGEGIDPETTIEQAFIFCTAVLGAILMAVIIGNISLVLQNSNALAALHQNKMDVINDAMRAMDISPRLQRKTVAYYELLWTRQRALSTKSSFIDELSPCLRKEINLDLNTEVIYRCELFKNLLDRDTNALENIMNEETSDHILVAIVNALEREVFLVGDTIIQQGEIGQEMFFLVRGLISIEKMVFDEKTNEYGNVEIAKLKAGSYFGELSLLRKGGRSKQRRAASCISLTNADTRILRKDIFHEVCEDFPELRTYLQAEADRKYAKFSKPSEEKKEEKKEEVQKSPERIKKLNSIIAALSQKNVEIVASPNSVQNVIGKKGEAWGLPTPTMTSIQTALDSINLRMSRLEINMSRLQAKGSGVSNDNSVIPLPSKLKSYGSRGRNYITSPNASDKKGPKEPPKSKGWARIRKIVQPTPTTPREILTSLIVEENDNEDNKNNDSETNGRRKKRDGRRTPSSTNSSGRLSSPRNLSNSRWGSQPSEDEETRRREQEERQKKLSNRRW